MEELIDVLHTCNDLSHPMPGFWNLPLLIAYPVIEWYGFGSTSNSRIQITLYAH
jgi:hypothetical protein